MGQRVRYTKEEVVKNRHYQLPKFLFEEMEFNNLSNDARVLYAILRDRHDLSIKNGWVNKKNEVYLIYKRSDLCDMLNCTLPTLRKAFKQLTDCGLIEEELMGHNRPNRIYLTTVAEGSNDKVVKKVMKTIFTPKQKKVSSRSERNLHPGVKNSFTPFSETYSFSETDLNNTHNQSINHTEYDNEKSKEDGLIDSTKFDKEKYDHLRQTLQVDNFKQDDQGLLLIALQNICAGSLDKHRPRVIVYATLEKMGGFKINKAIQNYSQALAENKIKKNKVGYFQMCLLNAACETENQVSGENKSTAKPSISNSSRRRLRRSDDRDWETALGIK